MVLVIITLVGSLVSVNIGRGHGYFENRQFAQSMMDACRKARKRAAILGMKQYFWIAPDERKWLLNKGEHTKKIPEEIIIEGEDVGVTETGRYYAVFFPDGSSSGGEFLIKTDREKILEFRIDMFSGAVEIVDGG